MSTSGNKCPRQSTEQSSPRAGSKDARRSPFAPSSSPSSSSSQSPSPPRRRDLIKSAVVNVIRKRSSTAVPQYRGVRYREELNKYVSEIRPTRCAKKIWLGTYDTAEEAARAFDIGNLCCNKNLPLNFADSPTMLKKISSNLSPEEARSAIAKLAKEVARLYSGNPGSSSCEVAKPEPFHQAAMAHSDIFPCEPHSEFSQFQAFQPQQQVESVPQIHNLAAGIYSETYFEQLPENVYTMEVATTMPMTNRGDGSRSWEFDLSIGSDVSISEMNFPDDLSGIPILNDMPAAVIDNHMFEDNMYQAPAQFHAQDGHMYQDQVSGGQVFGGVYFRSF